MGHTKSGQEPNERRTGKIGMGKTPQQVTGWKKRGYGTESEREGRKEPA